MPDSTFKTALRGGFLFSSTGFDARCGHMVRVCRYRCSRLIDTDAAMEAVVERTSWSALDNPGGGAKAPVSPLVLRLSLRRGRPDGIAPAPRAGMPRMLSPK
jgi:hypothetical protein